MSLSSALICQGTRICNRCEVCVGVLGTTEEVVDVAAVNTHSLRTTRYRDPHLVHQVRAASQNAKNTQISMSPTNINLFTYCPMICKTSNMPAGWLEEKDNGEERISL